MTVELKGIAKQYGSTYALRDIDLTVQQGEFLTLLGPTGCGKSTLLRVIAGFVTPSAGEVRIGGQVMTAIAPNRRPVGLLFQSYALFPHMTVEQNVSFGLRMQGFRKEAIAKKVDEMLPLVGIEALRKRYPSQLSGGQQQRTALARTLAIEPQVLLLDEPLAALDRKLKLEMQSELKQLVTRLGITTICVSHDQDEALTMSDRVAVLNDGRIEQVGPPLELYDRPQSGFTAGFLGRSNLLEGTLAAGENSDIVFSSGSFRVPVQTDRAAGEDVLLLLRPEHLVFDATPSASSLAGTIRFVTQFGHSMQYEVSLDTGPNFFVASARTRGITPLLPGARVLLSPNSPSAYQILPA